MRNSVRVRAFAKINLGLRVLGLRSDGYHEIRTVFQTIDLHDQLEITLERGSGISILCADPSIPSGRDNLVYGACKLWRTATRFAGSIRVILGKRIPAGSGLGGGSSDATACVLGLEELTGDFLDAAARFRIAAKLGSDVPFFLIGGRVLGCGRGEEVYPLTDLARQYHCLVVFPGFKASTAEAYKQIAGQAAPEFRPVRGQARGGGSKVATAWLNKPATTPVRPNLTKNPRARKVNSFGVWSQYPCNEWGPAENDFEQFVFAKWPELERLKIQFIRAGAETALLTGSGSAIYAIFDSARQLNRACGVVPPGWTVFRTRTLSRHEYQRMIVDR
jgi:4-diphosphocytidyl-2-C-methyl-D-erythritol kinase